MKSPREYVDAVLRTSREVAACIGRIQNPASDKTSRRAMDSKIGAARFVLEDFSEELEGEFATLDGGPVAEADLQAARQRLLGARTTQIEVWAIQHAGRFQGIAQLAQPSVMMINAVDAWQTGIHGIRTSRGSTGQTIVSLRQQANATFVGMGLCALSDCFSGKNSDDLRLLANATLRVETDGGYATIR